MLAIINRNFLLAVLCVYPGLAAAISADYRSLLDKVQERQPETVLQGALSESTQAAQTQADSWIGGDVVLKFHHENDSGLDNQSMQNWQLGAEVPIQLPSHRQANQALAEGFNYQNSIYSRYLRLRASETLRRIVWSYRQAEIELQAAQENYAGLSRITDRVRLRAKLGEVPKLDVLMAEQSLLEAETQLRRKQADLDTMQGQYRAWSGSDNLPADIEETLRSERSFDEHPKIQWLQGMTQTGEAKVQQARAQKYASPSIYLGAQQDRTVTGEDHSWVVEFSVPLGTDPQHGSRVAEAKQALSNEQQALLQAKQQLLEDQIKAQAELSASRQAMEAAQQQQTLQQQALQMADKSYRWGESSLSDFLRVQNKAALANSRLLLTSVKYQQAIANLNQLYGYALDE
ncbi:MULTISPECIES: TolC family protein [Thiomicrorhabdus]|uniref:TolC family protein n=1 Tax=Thiomicrorhabdus heinhorstiae TaxID=2748010 RepID=A0ABS0C086_9GAMM|nr:MULTISPECIES: TolC family protein [Thiomicrorhabdus]MBF6058748.1 TolC family protein [Thiomicrorhabdus heinhorstiae]